MNTTSLQELYIQSYSQDHDPTFSEHNLIHHILQAGRSQKKAICYFLPDRCINLQESKAKVDTADEYYNGTALSTMMYLGYHFTHNDNKLNIMENFCKGQDLSDSTNKDISELVKTSWIINPEDKDTSSRILIVLLFPVHIFPDIDN